MRKEENSIELLERYTIGSVEYDLLKVALETQDEESDVEELIALFETALESLEISYWRSEIQKIGDEFNQPGTLPAKSIA